MWVDKKVDKPCEDCGTMLLGVSMHRKRCPKCARERERERSRQRKAEQRARERVLAKSKIAKPKRESIEDINRKAKAANMSYGQYVAMMNERKEKMK